MKRILFVLLILLAFTFSITGLVDAAVPYVASTSPAVDAVSVGVNDPIEINFSESVLWGEVYNTGVYRITLAEDATGTPFTALVYLPASNSDTYVLSLTSALKSNTKYRVTVSNVIRSESTEEMMAVPYEFFFTTQTTPDTEPPTITSAYPAAAATDIPLDTKVVIHFSEPMNDSTITDSYLRLYDTALGDYIPVSVTYDSTNNSAVITPSSPLVKSRVYYIVVFPNVQDLAGNQMLNAYITYFTTLLSDTVKPTITSTNPVNGATGVTSDTVKIVFSEPMDPASITGSTIVVTGPGGVPVSGTVSYDAASATASFLPDASFAFASDYTVTITTGVRDLAGNYMAAVKVIKFTTIQATAPAAMSAYSQIPPFIVGGTVQPNVLLIVDNSGSMDEQAYYGNYSSATNYYGYFDSNKMYTYDSGGKYFEANTNAVNRSTCTVFSNCSGNILNWFATRRVDAVRMVLVGGAKDNDNYREYYPGGSFTKTYSGNSYRVTNTSSKAVIRQCTNGSCSTYNTYYAKVKISDTERDDNPGLIRQFKDKMRLGIMNFNGGYNFEDKGTKDGGVVQINIGQTGADFVTQILNTPPSTWTPLAETLYEATRYFAASTSAYNGGNYPSGKPIEYSCQKNFVLILTDGESTKDKNIPGGAWTSWNGSAPVADTGFNVKNYLDGNAGLGITGIKALEGWASSRWNVSTGSDGTWYLPGVAYYAHKKDLRSDLDGIQNLTIYTVFAFDDSATAKELLKLAAKYGGFDDTNGTGAPDSTAKWDKNGDGIPDTYFEASDGNELKTAIEKAFNDILARVSSGTAASILNNSEGSGANLLQAVFYPKKTFDGGTEVSWIGEVQNLWYYLDPYLLNSSIRVDSVFDKKLNLKEDQIAHFEFDSASQQTVVRLASDTNGDGVADGGWSTFTPDDAVNVKSLWRAGRLLWERNIHDSSKANYAPRTIYTRTGGLVDTNGTSFDGANGLAKLSYSIESGYTSKLTIEPFFQQLLQAANVTEADKLVKYLHGVPVVDGSNNIIGDSTGYRSRLVTLGATNGIWRLGDIVSSTPKLIANIALNTYAVAPPTGYGDTSYDKFVKSSVYQNRGMVFVGANDGMLHAFKLGTLKMLKEGSNRAQLAGSDLGKEEWAFVPRNMLPYLRYLADPDYSHLFYVDGSTLLVDAAIRRPTDNDSYKNSDNSLTYPNCTDDQYWKCIKKTTYSDTSTKTLDLDKSSWRTVLIGSTGLGGAGRNRVNSSYCYDKLGSDCVKTPVTGVGFSTYYALDVTDPANPKFMWEFNGDPTEGADADKKGGNLGYATSGPVVVRVGDKDKNGRWFAVFASGPTGPIDTINRQFLGRSDQPLKLFIVDIGTGKLVTTIDTGIANAFSGSLSNGAIDTDKSKPFSSGFYSDDALYVGYTQKSAASEWYKGGVVRVLTKESIYPDSTKDLDDPDNPHNSAKNWSFSEVINGIGPVTSAVTKLQDRANGNLWLYFGEGRYFYKNTSTVDDPVSSRRIFGVKDGCYDKPTNDMSNGCSPTTLALADLQSQTTLTTFDVNKKGWYITLDASGSTSGAERVITDPVASPNGVVFYTTFQPSSDVCAYGGSSYIWAVDYSSGGTPSPRAMQGKLLMQVSTGAFAEVSMSSAFTAKDGRRTGTAFQGVPPKAQGLSVLTSPRPLKKVMHVQER